MKAIDFLDQQDAAPQAKMKAADFLEQNDPGFVATVKRTGGQMLESAGHAVEDIAGPGVVSGWMQGSGRDIAARNPAGINSFSDIAEHPVEWVKESAGNMAPQMGATLAGAAGGRAIGTALGGAVGGFFGGVGAAPGAAIGGQIGQWAGAALPTLVQEYGGIRGEQKQKGIDDKPQALMAAVPATAIEFAAGPQRILGNLMTEAGREAYKKVAGEGAKDIAKFVGKEALKGGAGEAMEEYPQTLLETWGAHGDPFSAEAQKEAAFSSAMAFPGGGLGSGAMTGAGVYRERGQQAPVEPGGGQDIAGLLPAPPLVTPTQPTGPDQAAITAADQHAESVQQARQAEEARREQAMSDYLGRGSVDYQPAGIADMAPPEASGSLPGIDIPGIDFHLNPSDGPLSKAAAQHVFPVSAWHPSPQAPSIPFEQTAPQTATPARGNANAGQVNPPSGNAKVPEKSPADRVVDLSGGGALAERNGGRVSSGVLPAAEGTPSSGQQDMATGDAAPGRPAVTESQVTHPEMRTHIEGLIKRRAAARQNNIERTLDGAIEKAKAMMRGESNALTPGYFKAAAKKFEGVKDQNTATLLRGIADTVTNIRKSAGGAPAGQSSVETQPAPTTQENPNGLQVQGQAPAQEVASVNGGLRAVDVFGNGSRIDNYDDKNGLMYSAQRLPSGTKWTVFEVSPPEGGGEQILGEMFGYKSLEDAQEAVRGLRISATKKEKNQAKYGGIPDLWRGEERRVAKALIDSGIGVARFSSSTQSRSKYIHLDNGSKVRMSDHALPGAYDQPDFDYRYGGDINALVDEIRKAEEGAPTPDSRELGSQALSNQDAGAASLRADESGQLEEPAQSGSGAGSTTMLSEKAGDGKKSSASDMSAAAPSAQTVTAPSKGEASQSGAESAIDAHLEFARRVRSGEVTADEFKAAYADFKSARPAMEAELNSKTLKQLAPNGAGGMKKAEVVERTIDHLGGIFTLGKAVSYVLGAPGGYDGAVAKIVAGITDADLAKYAGDVKQAKEERSKAVEDAKKAISDPKTLEDYRTYIRAKKSGGMTFTEARMTLSPEQRAAFDDLTASESRSERKESADRKRSDVRVAATTTDGQIIETKHTRDGYPLFVVKAAERVERDVYNQWNATAKRLGGWYSAFRGNGAIPGFQFKTRDSAQAFLEFIGGNAGKASEAVQARRDVFEDDRSQSAVERLNEMADAIEERANESIGRERKENTARRARMAASAEAAANADIAMARTMRNIAIAIEKGKAKFLDRVRQKVQIGMLTGILWRAQDAELRTKYQSYAEREKHLGERPTIATADHAEFPQFTFYRSDLASVGRLLLEMDGTKKLGERLLKVADDVTETYLSFAKENLHKVSRFSRGDGEMAAFGSRDNAEKAIARSGFKGKAIVLPFKRGQNIIIMSPTAAQEAGIWQGDADKRITLSQDFGLELAAKHKELGKRSPMPWFIGEVADRVNRLKAMGIETPAEFRAMVREFIQTRAEAPELDKVKQMERAMVGRKSDGLDFFPTPGETAQRMVDAAEIEEGMSVLEPSAGMGHIADKIKDAGVWPDVVEMSGDRRELLNAKGFHIAGTDFMDMEPRKFFTFGDVFRAPDGVEGIMRGAGGMGSQRVRLEDENGNQLGLYDRNELTGIGHRGSWSGYDRIIMNPPFSNRRDAQHVQHAYELLRPGGRLVALMGEGVFFGQDQKAKDFRDWLDSVGGTSEKLEEGTFLDSSLPVNTGVNARMVVIEKPTGDVNSRADKPAPMESRAGYSREDFARNALFELAFEDDLFRYKVSKAGTLQGVMRDVFPGAQYVVESTREDEKAKSGADHRYTFLSPDTPAEDGRPEVKGKQFDVFVTRDRVWVDFHWFQPGDQGSRAYAAVANFAYNTRRVFGGDPAGVSTAAVIARTKMMLSSALRFGTTRHLEPSVEQERGIPAAMIPPLAWKGSDVEKTRSLLHTFLETVQNNAPAIKNYSYDFQKRRWINNSTGLEFRPSRAAFDAALGEGQRRAAGVGPDSGRLAIFIQSLVRGRGGEAGDGGILEAILNHSRSLIEEGGLRGMLSKKTPAPAGVSVSGGKTLKAKAIQGVADKFRRGFNGAEALDVRVVDSREDIPEAFRPSPYAEGVFHDNAGRIYLIAENLPSVQRAWQVLLHEAVGHYGLAHMMGTGFKPILKRVYAEARAKGDSVLDVKPGDADYATVEAVTMAYPFYEFSAELQARNPGRTYTTEELRSKHRDVVAQEVLARMAETSPNRLLLGYAKMKIRELANAVLRALGVSYQFQANELNDLIVKAAAYLRAGGNMGREVVPGGMVAASKSASMQPMSSKGAGAPSADKSPSPADADLLTSQSVADHINASEDGYFGFRGIPTSRKKVRVGDILQHSFLWDFENDRPSKNKANGTSTIGIAEYGEADPESISSAARQVIGYGGGETYVLVTGRHAGYGDGDFGETLVSGAKVVRVYSRAEIEAIAKSENEPTAPDNPGAMESRRSISDAIAGRKLKNDWANSAKNRLADAIAPADGKTFGFWHKTIGTQLHKARVNPHFRKVFDRGQRFLDDITLLAMRAEAKAPDILPRIGSLKDVMKSGLSAVDDTVVGRALTEGTLAGGENPENGRVWTDAELKAKFGMGQKQVGLYRQARAAIDQSLDDLAKAEIMQVLRLNKQGSLVKDLIGLDAPLDEVASWIDDQLNGAAENGDTRAAQAKKEVAHKVERVSSLKRAGYAPLMRFGRHAVTMRNTAGQVSYFGLFESAAEAMDMKRSLEAEFDGNTVSIGQVSQESWRLFKGVAPDTIEVFGGAAGGDEMFQEYLKLAVSNRSTMKRLIHRKGTMGYSNGATRILARFLTSNARRASTVANMPELKKAVLDIPQDMGDVKDEAAKLADYLQNPGEEVAKFRGFLFFQYLGGSIAAGLVNLTQPVLMTLPWLAQYGGAGKASKALAAAMRPTFDSMLGKPASDRKLAEAMDRAKQHGITDPQEIYQLMAAAETEAKSMLGHKFMRLWGSNFALTEAINRRLTFVAAWNVAQDMSGEDLKKAGAADAFEFAVQAVEDTQGIYNKGNRPNWARGDIGSLVFTFKQYSIAYVEFLKRLYGDGKLPRRQFMMALGLMILAAGLSGLPGADDLDDIIDTLGNWLGFATNSERWKRQALTAAVGSGAADFILHGVSTIPGMPMDVSARLGVANLIPGTAMFNPTKPDKTREITEVVGVAGGLLSSAGQGMERLAKGDLRGMALSVLPTALRNAYQGMEMGVSGEYRTADGKLTVKDVGAGEALVKGIGFNPSRVAEEGRALREVRADIDIQRTKEAEIADRLAKAIHDKDPAARKSAMDDWQAWNRKNPEHKIIITPAQIRRRVMEMNRTREERFTRSAPKEMRASVTERI